jgi:uncharacterized phage protein (predicted DNA packaging)
MNMAMLDDVKIALRVSHSMLDGEINDLIAAARQDLLLSGVVSLKANSSTDPLVKRAVTSYVKAYIGYDNPDYERLVMAYEKLKMHLTLSGDYS